MLRGVRKHLLAVALLLPAFACTEAAAPGELIGNFALVALPDGPGFTDCQLSGLADAGFTFSATLRWEPTDGGAWMVVGPATRDATWDGATFSSTASGTQQFADCQCAQVQVEETVTLALLSRSQATAAGIGCPPNALDGGVPAPDADAGISAPGPTARGFDAVRACGELVDVLRPAATCACAACTVRYRLQGERP